MVVSAGSGNSKIEMRKEVAAMSSTADVKASAAKLLSRSLVNLKFVVNKPGSTIEGFYSINGATEVSIGTLNIPQSFTKGKTLGDGVTGNITFAGIFATHRSAATSLTFSFEDFKIEPAIVNASFNPDSLNSSIIQRDFISGIFASESNLLKPKVYPNPLHKIFNIEFPGAYTGKITIQIIDQLGRINEIGKYKLKPGGSNIRVDISTLFLRTGVYSLMIHSETRKTEAIKIVVL